MAPHPSNALRDDEIHRMVDGQVSLEQLADLQVRLTQDPDAQAAIARWQSQRQALNSLHSQLLDEPLPATLLAAATKAYNTKRTIHHWTRWGAMAASIVFAFSSGWLLHGHWQLTPAANDFSVSNAHTGKAFIRQAAIAHSAFVPEVRHPVEVRSDQQDHLVQWLSKRLGRPLKVPNLSSLGFELVGGRLLPGEDGVRAQFMFQNHGGERVTLYLGAVHPQNRDLSKQESAFQFSNDGPIPGFYWVDQGFGYALSGAQTKDGLLKLAQTVYQQL